MPVIKCKMCGGDLNLIPGESVVACEYCGRRQTVPSADSEKKLTLFARANRLRAGCEFDKAAGVYESIVADFPEEAEAYWGLVLCKYGIEYVDDPATGEKIPTCHRSSFESVLEDSDFEQAQENADVVARKQYREEAKQLEALRKGIIAVSANEQPYDIFICYKETDENGDRTLDSVLAQDIYDALTEKGYRVFFARISLEDKLGTEYEPYIFAALNSAKIMLAVGTDYEYYNAVWVKNEWSRFLKLMAQDKTRHLIPCFKNLDAYDMPKEFAKLQAQDLGKVGAMQDLLRGIEKILPKSQPVTVVQERVVVGGGGYNKIASLLDRGNMALEDGDWAKADSFFEDVLNNDSKNAQAYLGKALAQEQCRTMDALVRKRKNASQSVRGETLELKANDAHVTDIVEKYRIPGYVEEADIRALYKFDRSYHSNTAERKRQYRDEETYWSNHKTLARAEKFAAGAVAENLAGEKKTLFAELKNRIAQAEQEEAQAVTQLKEAYAAHIREADTKAEARYQAGLAHRENDYQARQEKAEGETDPQALLELAKALENLGDYKDSKRLAEQCRKRAEEEQERQRILRERKEAARRAKQKNIAAVSCAAMAVVIAAFLVVTKVIIPGNQYRKAEILLASGQYEEAIAAFEALDNYRDSAERIEECELALLEEQRENQYNAAVSLMQEGKYEEAIAAFEALDGYGNSITKITECENAIQEKAIDTVLSLKAEGKGAEALSLLDTIDGYQDAEQLRKEILADIREEIAPYQAAVSAGWSHTVGLKSDGTVVAVGTNKFGQCDISDWKDIAAISAGLIHTVGLKSDGTVITVGDKRYGQCSVSDWRDIVAISAGGYHTVGLKSDGTVVAVGNEEYDRCNVSDWKDIVAVSAGRTYTVGLKADGTAVAVGYNEDSSCDISDWRDIVAVSTGEAHMVGLKSDGTVVAVGNNNYGQCSISDWKDIVAIAAGDNYTVGLRADGSVVAVGYNNYGQCNVSDWRDIVAVSANHYHTVGLKSYGTVVVVSNELDQRRVSGWKNIGPAK